MRKKLLKVLAVMSAAFMLLGSVLGSEEVVLAASESEEAAEENENQADSELKENSWRFQDGELIEQPSKARSGYRYTWEKVDGYYRNPNGDIIPGALKKGIDVSYHNGKIDWEKVKADGIDFAIIRCGYGDDDTRQDDSQWSYNVSECERLGIPYGVYIYSYADSVSHAQSEADHVLRLLAGHYPSYPVYYDMEDDSTLGTSASLKGQMAQTFCDKVSAAGYQVGIYANKNWWTNYLTDSRFDNPSWSKWVAQYNDVCDYEGDYNIWQCTSSGSVDGISGSVDINFEIYADLIDQMDPSYTGMAVIDDTWYYLTNGEIDTAYEGMAENQYGWWYIKNGTVDWSYTGMAENQYGWWYMRNGTVDWDYEGMANNQYGWWYMKNGTVAWNYEGMAYNQYGWWYMTNGTVDWDYEGMAENSYGWWYMTNGTVDWDYEGMAENQYGWWYIKNGTVDWSYTGMAENQYGWWYMTNGTVNWNYTGVIEYNGSSYNIVNGFAGQGD